MNIFKWLQSKSIKFRILSLVVLLLLPVCILIQYFILPNFKERIYEGKKENTRYAVEIALGTINKFYNDFKDKKMTEEAAKEAALKSIKDLRYNEKEYFWINDQTPKMIMHPINEKLIGQDLSEKKDAKGKLLFVEMAKIVKEKNGGFLDYYWERPGETIPVPKISYVKGFAPWGWIIGTGIYVDSVETQVRDMSVRIWQVMIVVLALAVVFVIIFSNHLAKTLVYVSSKITDGAKSFKDSSDNINQSSQEVSNRTNSSAAALQETSASLEEISSMIKKSSDNMETLQSIANASKKNVNYGKQSLEEMAQNLNQISHNNEKINKQIETSNEEISNIINLINEISEKTKVINDIVFQTKLLSFNASVEAARAGENGKGFAVVAEEVGNLAKMSGVASIEISQILEKSTQKVKEIVTKTQSNITPLIKASVDSLEHGIDTAKNCTKSFDQIVNDSDEINQMVQETFTAFQEQNIAVSEISKAVSDLDLLTHQNANSAKENVMSAIQLTNEAIELNEISHQLSIIINGTSENSNYKKVA